MVTAGPASRVTWWGQSTATIEDRGVRVLTDPVFTQRLAHLYRRRGPAPAAEARRADLVLVSHLHADHLHLPSLRLVAPGAVLVVPRGAATLLRGLPHAVPEVEPGDRVEVGPVTVDVVRAVHDGFRLPTSTVHGPALGFVVDGTSRTYFSGDTEDFAGVEVDVGRLVDTVLDPVGGWGPTLGAGHMGPVQAVSFLRRLRPRLAVPVHWGTFWPRGLHGSRDHRFIRPGPELAERAATGELPGIGICVLRPGESLRLTTGVAARTPSGRPDDA